MPPFRVLFLTDEVQLRRPDVGVLGALPHLVHVCTIADGVVDVSTPVPLVFDPRAVRLVA